MNFSFVYYLKIIILLLIPLLEVDWKVVSPEIPPKKNSKYEQANFNSDDKS